MVGGSVEEYVNRDTREVSQFEDKPQSEQTYLRDFEKDHRNIEEKMPYCGDCGLIFENISDLADIHMIVLCICVFNHELLWMTGIHLPGKYDWSDLISWILK
jgi:hypothetical protein